MLHLLSDLIQNIFNCVPKTNEAVWVRNNIGVSGKITTFSFGGGIPLSFCLSSKLYMELQPALSWCGIYFLNDWSDMLAVPDQKKDLIWYSKVYEIINFFKKNIKKTDPKPKWLHLNSFLEKFICLFLTSSPSFSRGEKLWQTTSRLPGSGDYAASAAHGRQRGSPYHWWRHQETLWKSQ